MIIDVNRKRGYIELRRSDGRVNGKPKRKYLGRVRIATHGATRLSPALARQLSAHELAQVQAAIARCEAERDPTVPRAVVQAVFAGLVELEACLKSCSLAEEDGDLLQSIFESIQTLMGIAPRRT
ncbi:MAG: hypothetical protein ACM3N6_01275 [Betaproteobacteria bacterium]